MDKVERIMWGGELLACIVRDGGDEGKTNFITPPDYNFQVGFVVYPEGGEIAPHSHRPVERNVVGTFEVLVVRKGRCEVDIFNGDRERIATRELRTGDVMLVVEGGHGFRMLEDTVLLEIKQGPYTGQQEKELY